MENRRNFRFELRLNEEEYKLFQKKSQSYNGNISALIRDAVSRFDDQKVRGKIETMAELVNSIRHTSNNSLGLAATLIRLCTEPKNLLYLES